MRKPRFWLGFACSLAVLLFCGPLTGTAQTRGVRTDEAQTRDKFVISAKAGGVNAVTGNASVHARGTGEWRQLTIKEDLEAGDVVKTGPDGRVEMLLNPGSYLRIGENSEFELANNSLDNLELRLARGTAIVEATGADDTELAINITTPDTKLAIVRRGLYRLNVVPGDGTELIVRKGRVMLGDSHTKIKGGNKVIFTSSGGVSVAKLDKADKKKVDTLDAWSKERAETLAKANSKLRNRDLATAFSVYNSWWDPFSYGSSRARGLWVYHPAFRCYTFLPFGGWGWGSPYGNSYGNVFGGCCGRSWGNGYPNGGSNGRGNGSGGGGIGGGSGSGNGNGGGNISPAPMPMPAPREIPRAAEGKAMRVNERLPNQ